MRTKKSKEPKKPKEPKEPKTPKEPKKPKKPREPGSGRDEIRWLHAGLYKDPHGNTENIWYAIRKNKLDYAADKQGTLFGNYNVGLRKRDLITWDSHLIENWEQYLTTDGQWRKGDAMRGRKAQRDALKHIYEDPRFIDPHSEGRNGSIGSSVNVIHPPKGVGVRPENPRGKCYPRTKIPLSCAHMKPDAYKEIDPNALRVVMQFLSGELANRGGNNNQSGFERLQIDRAESAFHEHGFRINREAADRASQDVRTGRVNTLMNSNAWIDNPPLRVDRFKGKRVVRLIKNMWNALASPDRDNESDDEDYNNSDDNSNDRPNDSTDDEDTTDQDDSDDSDSDDSDLDDNNNKPHKRTSKGRQPFKKKKSTAGQLKASKNRNGRQRQFIDVDGEADEEDEDEADPEESEFERELLKGFLAAKSEMADECLRPTPEVGEGGPSKWRRAMIDSDEETDNDSNADDDDDDDPPRPAPTFSGLRSLHMETIRKGSSLTTPPKTPTSDADSGHPSPLITRRSSRLPSSSLAITISDDESSPPTPLRSPKETGSGSKRPSPINVKDEDEDELETQRGPSPKRVKAEEPFAWVKNEDGAEIIILDDDEEEMYTTAKAAAAKEMVTFTGTGTGDDPFTID